FQIDGPDGSPGESFSLVFQGQRRARATLEIQVVDVNDNAPQFVNAPAVISVPENDMFTVDKARCGGKECTTTLRLAKALDFESQRIHHVLITAEDGNPRSNRTLFTTHTITVHVTDEDE
ncbi:hypothetical protein COOONC_21442, partial [Cooperia oncophora]